MEPFSKIKDVDPKILANFIQNEHPQTIAVIVAHLDASRAGEVIREFPENLQYEVILRVATLETVPPSVVREIDSVLEEEVMTSVDQSGSGPVGGVQAVAELLNHCGQGHRRGLFWKGLRSTRPNWPTRSAS